MILTGRSTAFVSAVALTLSGCTATRPNNLDNSDPARFQSIEPEKKQQIEPKKPAPKSTPVPTLPETIPQMYHRKTYGLA